MHRLVLGAFVCATLSTTAFATGPTPAPANIKIKGLAYSGNGCPMDTVSSSLSPNGDNLFVQYSEFGVSHTGQVGKKQSVSEQCTLRLRMQVPVGYQFAVVTGQAEGFAGLDSGASGTITVRSGFNLFGILTSGSSLTLKGAYNDSYTHKFDMPLRALSWSPCSGNERDLVVNTSVTVKTVGAVSGMMTVDTDNFNVTNEYGLIWRQCTPKPPRAVVAVCRAQFTKGISSDVHDVQGHAMASTLAAALSQAQTRANARCDKRSQHVGGSACTVPVNPCQTLSL